MLLQVAPETFRTVDEELLLFFGAILLGIPAGIVFDVTRLFRKLLKHNIILVALEDILYFILISFLMLCYISAFGRGEFRVYYLVGCFLGFMVYYYTLGAIIMRFSDILLMPVHWVWNKIIWICGKLKQAFVKYAKKLHFAKKNSQNDLSNPPHKVYNSNANQNNNTGAKNLKKQKGRLHGKRKKNKTEI
ncbi:MAG: spore cortex biosynthesis protein YabQ [Oscillospiraceae bacterium]|nr:spore cortex biosynthesis protein YabQ [Oscillospiraceae bacterium]